MKKIDVEVCAFSLDDCITAQHAGATRVELCGGILEGGTTPSSGLINLVKEQVNIDVFVMIRPRGGDFLYSESEYLLMQAEILNAKKIGVKGIVLGLLKENGEVDFEKTNMLVELAYPMKVTFHRAIDMTPNPIEAMEKIIEAGCIRILTSGQKNKAMEGIEIIGMLVEKANSRIEIMAGSGVNDQNARFFIKKGVDALHLTGKSIRNSEMKYRKSDISMSSNSEISEYDIAFTDMNKIKAVVEIAKSR